MRPSSAWSTTARERRSVIAPPEMTNGSSSGSVSSSSSARAMRIGHEVEKVQFPVATLQGAPTLEVQEADDQAVGGVEDQLVERALGARTVGGRILVQGQLEERVKLDGRAAAARILEDHPAGM